MSARLFVHVTICFSNLSAFQQPVRVGGQSVRQTQAVQTGVAARAHEAGAFRQETIHGQHVFWLRFSSQFSAIP